MALRVGKGEQTLSLGGSLAVTLKTGDNTGSPGFLHSQDLPPGQDCRGHQFNYFILQMGKA